MESYKHQSNRLLQGIVVINFNRVVDISNCKVYVFSQTNKPISMAFRTQTDSPDNFDPAPRAHLPWFALFMINFCLTYFLSAMFGTQPPHLILQTATIFSKTVSTRGFAYNTRVFLINVHHSTSTLGRLNVLPLQCVAQSVPSLRLSGDQLTRRTS